MNSETMPHGPEEPTSHWQRYHRVYGSAFGLLMFGSLSAASFCGAYRAHQEVRQLEPAVAVVQTIDEKLLEKVHEVRNGLDQWAAMPDNDKDRKLDHLNGCGQMSRSMVSLVDGGDELRRSPDYNHLEAQLNSAYIERLAYGYLGFFCAVTAAALGY
jgi:hypothetical protein